MGKKSSYKNTYDFRDFLEIIERYSFLSSLSTVRVRHVETIDLRLRAVIGQLGLSNFDASSRQNLKFARGQRTDHRSSKLKAFAVFFRPTFQLLVSLLHITQAKNGK